MPRWRRNRLAASKEAAALHAALLAGLGAEPVATLGIAVSGGGDSLALLHLAAELAPETGWRLAAATVDHRLRPEAAGEASRVAAICEGLSIPHRTLIWDHGGAIRGNLMEAARRARYALLADWARAAGLGQVALAHTADDQAETFLMGLSRGAGLDGLTGMRAGWSQGGVRFLRPLLGAARADLRAYLRGRGQGWIDDPSNDDPRFDRVKARRALVALAPLGVTAGGIAGTMAHLRAAQSALQEVTQDAARRIGRWRAGMIEMDHAEWCAQPAEIRRRLLVGALMELSYAAHAPRASAISRLTERAMAGGEATLWGCRVRAGKGLLRIMREPKAVAGQIAAPGFCWDGRWSVTGPFAPGMDIRALGPTGLGQCKGWRETGLPREALIVTPAVWQGERLVSAPLAGLEAGFSARIVAQDSLFSVSH